MTLKELKTNLETRIVEVDQKIHEVEEVLRKQKNPSEPLQDVLRQLKLRRDDIILEYDQIAAMQTEDEVRMPELEKNIYTNLEVFDSVFEKAGSMYEGSRFRNRDRDVDFKNPLRTK